MPALETAVRTELERTALRCGRNDDDRLLFLAIAGAFANWPITHSFRPSSKKHLQAYLLVRAGHCTIIGQNLIDEADIFRMADFTERLLAAVRKNGSFGFAEISGRKSLVVRFPKPIDCRHVDQKEFAQVAPAVLDIIEQEIEIPARELVRGVERAA